MVFFKIYSKENKLIFNKNKLFCFLYKYKEGKELVYSVNLSETPSKFHSLFEYTSKSEDEKIKISMSNQHIEYEIEYLNQIEKGRIPIKADKKKWLKKSVKINNKEILEVEEFDNKKNLIFKLNDEIFNKLKKINKINEDGK